MKWLDRLFGSRSTQPQPQSGPGTRQVTVRNPLVIESPKIGFFNLLGPSGQAILDEDKAALGPLFAATEESNHEAPRCDVLMLYAHFEGDGRIRGAADGLREIIRKCNAPIAVVASENEAKSCIAAAKRTGYGQANLVLTTGRRGAIFPSFFAQLFGRMFQGKSMPMAWVELAPQAPNAPQDKCPQTLFLAEISHIVFKMIVTR